MQKEVIEYLKEKRKPYRLKVENMIVELEYSKDDKKINECMINVLRQKIRK